MDAGLVDLVVEVLHNRGSAHGPDWSAGSGCLVGGAYVLTAAHNVGKGQLLVRFPRPSAGGEGQPAPRSQPLPGKEEHPATILKRGDARTLDIAVLRVEAEGIDSPRPRYGRVDRREALLVEGCTAVGFPRHKEHREGGKPAPRSTAQVDGVIPTGENLGLDYELLTLHVKHAPRALESNASEWAGMSGAVVFAPDNVVVGVVTEHHLPEGESALSVAPVSAIDRLDDSEEWWEALLGGPAALVQLPASTPPPGEEARAGYKVTIDRLTRLFGGREDELTQLDEFLDEGSSRYAFVVGASGFGKSALLANWIRRLEERGETPCYAFLSRLDDAADRESTLRVLCQQLEDRQGTRSALPATADELQRRYLALIQSPKDGRRQLVIIDGLDEANANWFRPLFPPRPSPETRMVFSARTMAGTDQWLKALELSPKEVLTIPLAGFGDRPIRSLLRAAGGAAARFADDQAFVTQMLTISEGDPIYLHYLVEDILTGEINALTNLSQRPTGLNGYWDKWWEEIGQVARNVREAINDLLGYLLVVMGPIAAFELVEISDDDHLGSRLSLDQDTGPVRRFLAGGPRGLSLAHPRFRDYLVRDEDPKFTASERRRYSERVTMYCAEWRSNRSAYALRHYAEHLASAPAAITEGRRASEPAALYALAHNDDYLAAQLARFPDEPELVLRTISLALRAAVADDDAGPTAEFLLRHARWAKELSSESPLSALEGGLVRRAWAVADLNGPELSVAWHLILAWKFCEVGRATDSQETVHRLFARSLPALTIPLQAIVAVLLPRALPPETEEFSKLAEKLNESARGSLSVQLARSGHIAEALGLAQSMADSERGWVLSAIAQALEEVVITGNLAGRIDEALGATAAALKARGLKGQQRSQALSFLARAYASVRDQNAAASTADAIEDDWLKAQALVGIAIVQSRAGLDETARCTLKAALDVAATIEDNWAVAGTLAQIATAQAELGEHDSARSTGLAARTRAEAITGFDAAWGRAVVLAQVAITEGRAGDQDSARKTFERAVSDARSLELQKQWQALVSIARIQARAGQEATAAISATAAAGRAEALAESGQRAAALAHIAAVETEIGQQGAARSTLAKALTAAYAIESHDEQLRALAQIAAIQAEGGQEEAARATLAGALEAAGESGDWSRSRALSQIAGAQARSGGHEAALLTAQAIRETRWRSQAFGQIAAAQAAAGKDDEARTTLDAAFKTAPAIRDDWHQQRAFVELAVIQAEVHGLEEGWAKAEGLSEPERSRALAEITVVRAKRGQLDAAVAGAPAIEKNWRSWTLRKIAAIQAENRQEEAAQRTLAGARQVARAIAKDSTLGASATLAQIAVAQAEIGQPAAAHESLAEALTLAEATKSDQERSEALARVALGQAGTGDDQAARATFGKALTLAETLETEASYRVLAEIALAQALSNQEAAIETAQSIDDNAWRAYALGRIASTRARTGRTTISERAVAAFVEDAGLSIVTFAAEVAEAADRQMMKCLLRRLPYTLPEAHALCGLVALADEPGANEVARVLLA